jgi:glycosyltransferase involved in cell wall biosynthesis
MGHRDDVAMLVAGRGIQGIRRSMGAVLRGRWSLVYLVDVGMSTTVAAVAGRLLRLRIVVDTGDASYALARSKGVRGPASLSAVWLGEKAALTSAHVVVIRGRAHARLLGKSRVTRYIPDLPPVTARPKSGDAARTRLALNGTTVIGLVGSINWAPRLGISYGWDLVEALAHLPADHRALIVGDGDGLERLKDRARALGVAERCTFPGRVSRADVADLIAAMDIAISTQTNDAVGAVRTTGKLPLYLACGRPVIASHVGEAGELLGPLGWTLRYDGVVDTCYPRRLAAAIARWPRDPAARRKRQEEALALAREHFDQRTWIRELDSLLADLLGPTGSP